MEKIGRIDIGTPVIERLPPPVMLRPELPSLAIPKPVVDVPQPRVEYPTLLLPPPLSAPTPQTSGETEKSAPKKEKDAVKPQPQSPPVVPPTPQVILPPQPPIEMVESPKPVETQNTIEIAGHDINVPTVKEVAQASTTAVIGTSATLATAMIFNQARRVMGETVSKAVRSKFKIKLKYVKPVLHMVYEKDGVTVLEYSEEGVKTLATSIENPEQFLRDLIQSDELFEADHRIVIDEPIKAHFTREGAKRFNYFAPSKKMARRLAARITFG
jgi:hypothetical protein